MPDQPSRDIVFGLLPPDAPIDPLLAELRRAGLASGRLTITSAVPPSHVDPQDRPLRPPLHVPAVLAGLVGIGVGLFFAGGTAAMYPLMTGGKPIVAWPVLAIISYETMMLCAIVTTFGGLLLHLRRMHRTPIPHDPRIYEGYTGLVLQADGSDPSPATLTRLLREGGALEVRTV